jgi:hypothetical protein
MSTGSLLPSLNEEYFNQFTYNQMTNIIGVGGMGSGSSSNIHVSPSMNSQASSGLYSLHNLQTFSHIQPPTIGYGQYMQHSGASAASMNPSYITLAPAANSSSSSSSSAAAVSAAAAAASGQGYGTSSGKIASRTSSYNSSSHNGLSSSSSSSSSPSSLMCATASPLNANGMTHHHHHHHHHQHQQQQQASPQLNSATVSSSTNEPFDSYADVTSAAIALATSTTANNQANDPAELVRIKHSKGLKLTSDEHQMLVKDRQRKDNHNMSELKFISSSFLALYN